jgi:MFS family permease
MNFGFSTGAYSLSTICGNLIGAYILKISSQYVFFLVMSILSVISFIVMLLLKDPTDLKEVKKMSDHRGELLRMDEHAKDNNFGNSESWVESSNMSAKLQDSVFSKLYHSLIDNFKALKSLKMVKFTIYVILSSLVFTLFAIFLFKMIANTIVSDYQKDEGIEGYSKHETLSKALV